ncbi:MAG: hypothetical protein ACRD8A_15890, partial [Candidatus Acidiferrales bacterium]
PIQNAVMYVEPLYLAAESGSSLPQLKRVIVAYSDQVVMEPTLEDALNTIFNGNGASQVEMAGGTTPAGGASTTTVAVIPSRLENLIQQANQHYEQAQKDLRQGDWGGYGEEMQRLGTVLKQMPPPKPQPHKARHR